MKAIFDSKDFLALESEEKLKVLELEKQKFDEEDVCTELERLKDEEAELILELSEIEDKMASNHTFNMGENNQAELVSVMSDLAELNAKAQTMKQKSIELDKNKNALELKSLLSRKNILENDIKNLKEEIENLRLQKIESQNSVLEMRSDYDNFYSSFNEEMARLMFEEKKVNLSSTCIYQEDKYDDYNIEEKIKINNEERLKLEEEISKLKDKLENINKEIAEIENKIREINISDDKKELIVQVNDLESEIIIYDSMLERIGKFLDLNKEELKSYKEKYSSEQQSEKKIQNDLDKIELTTSKVFEKSQMSNFQKLRSCDKTLSDISGVELELLIIDKQILNIKSRIGQRQNKLNNLRIQIEEKDNIYKQKALIVKELRHDEVKYQESREELLGNNCLGMLIKYTNIGDNCPICKTSVTTKNHVDMIDLAGIEKEIEMVKSKILYAEKDMNNALSEVSSMKAIEEYEEIMNEQDILEIKRLEESKINVYKKVVDVNDKTLENFSNLKAALLKTRLSLENVLSLQDSLRELMRENINKKIEYGTRISMLTEFDENLIDIYYTLQKERAEREMLLLQTKATVSGIFEEKRESFNNLEQKLSEMLSQLISLVNKSNEIKEQIFDYNKQLLEKEYESGKYSVSKVSSINVDSDEINSIYSIEEIKKKQSDLLESNKHLLFLKNDAELTLQNITKEYDVKTRILTYKIDELQDVTDLLASLMFRYNFVNAEEVNEYIVTDNMLKIKENEIKNYNSAVRKLELKKELLMNDGGNFIDVDERGKLVVKKQQLLIRQGELKILLCEAERKYAEYNTIIDLIEKYS